MASIRDEGAAVPTGGAMQEPEFDVIAVLVFRTQRGEDGAECASPFESHDPGGRAAILDRDRFCPRSTFFFFFDEIVSGLITKSKAHALHYRQKQSSGKKAVDRP